MFKVLIIEDDELLKSHLKMTLEKSYKVFEIEKFDNIHRDVENKTFDIVLLDLNLPNIYGSDLVSILKEKNKNVKIIVTTSDISKNSEIDLFTLGVDDYIKKPFDMDILKIRMDRLLQDNNNLLAYNDIEVDMNKMLLNEKVKLTKNDLIVISCLIKNSPGIVDYDILLRYLWENDEFVEKTALNMVLVRLRKKLNLADVQTEVKAVRNKGVMLV